MNFLTKNGLLLLIYLILFAVGACSYHNPQREIIKSWKVSTISIGLTAEDATNKGTVLKNVDFIDEIFYHFKEDGTYQITKNKQSDEGKWQLSADNKVLLLFSDLNPNDNIEFRVEQMTDFNLVLSTYEKGSIEKIVLIPQQ